MKKLVLTMTLAVALTTTAIAQNKVKNVYASTSKLNMEMLQNSEQPAQLNRYFIAGYNTLCLPFSLSSDQVAAAASNLRIERLAGIRQEGNALNLYFVDCTADGIQAGVPYLVYSPTTQYMRVKNTDALNFDTELKVIRMSDDNGNTISFGSGWTVREQPGRYGIPAKQNVTPLESVLVSTTSGMNFLPTRCGFSWDQQSSSATELKIQHAANMGEVTAIVGVKQTAGQHADFYSLDGKRLSGQQKGINITNGRKVVIK